MAELDMAGFIADVNYAMVDQSILLGTIALIVYECLITFGLEVRLFWGKEITGASILFFINRYMTLFYFLFSLRLFWPFTDIAVSACHQYTYVLAVFAMLRYIPWAGNYVWWAHVVLAFLHDLKGFSALRVLALTGRNGFVAAIVLVLSLGPVVINFVNFHWFSVVDNPASGCSKKIDQSSALALRLIVISRISLITADLIVLGVTWFTTYRTAMASRVVLNHGPPSLSGLLLRDGTIYFMIMVTVNILHLAFSATSSLVSQDGGIQASHMTKFSEPLTSVLTARFMMNLQDARRRLSGSTGGSGAGTASLVRFDRVIGSIGESLGPSIIDGDIYPGSGNDEAEDLE